MSLAQWGSDNFLGRLMELKHMFAIVYGIWFICMSDLICRRHYLVSLLWTINRLSPIGVGRGKLNDPPLSPPTSVEAMLWTALWRGPRGQELRVASGQRLGWSWGPLTKSLGEIASHQRCGLGSSSSPVELWGRLQRQLVPWLWSCERPRARASSKPPQTPDRRNCKMMRVVVLSHSILERFIIQP